MESPSPSPSSTSSNPPPSSSSQTIEPSSRPRGPPSHRGGRQPHPGRNSNPRVPAEGSNPSTSNLSNPSDSSSSSSGSQPPQSQQQPRPSGGGGRGRGGSRGGSGASPRTSSVPTPSQESSDQTSSSSSSTPSDPTATSAQSNHPAPPRSGSRGGRTRQRERKVPEGEISSSSSAPADQPSEPAANQPQGEGQTRRRENEPRRRPQPPREPLTPEELAQRKLQNPPRSRNNQPRRVPPTNQLNPMAKEFVPGSSTEDLVSAPQHGIEALSLNEKPRERSQPRSRDRPPRNSQNNSPAASASAEQPQQPATSQQPARTSERPAPGGQPRPRRRIPLPKGEGDLMNSLIAQLSNETQECMVCYENVKRRHETWSCRNCFAVFHLNCIKKWGSKSTDQGGWRCPGCQKVEEEVPKDYFCFCGQMKEPDWNPYSTPHSCGNICSRIRVGTSCLHPCTLPCHPGPCPTCKVKVPDGHCYCGKMAYPLRCGEFDKGKVCGTPCGKLLACKKHHCQSLCHPGECEPCSLQAEKICYCGKTHKTLLCGQEKQVESDFGVGFFGCEQVCNRALACGNHKCPKPCHPGKCGPCEYLPAIVNTCPCGNKAVNTLLATPRKSCLDPVPTCQGVCGKALHCVGNTLGISEVVHMCLSKCHTGECPPCGNDIKFSCQCGSTPQKSICSSETAATINEYKCKRVCREMRSCGKHQCGITCCPKSEESHRCKLTCNKKLQCGLHTCTMPCHKGYCYPCLQANFDEVACHCGETRLYPPIPCGAALPRCPYPCSRTHPCSHAPSHSCHNEESCPPCSVLVQKPCACWRKIQIQAACGKPFSNCGRPCEKALPCGHHCLRICHEGDCEDGQCKQTCGKRRKCGHRCLKPCHRESPCPSVPCTQQVTIMCKCGRKVEQVICGKVEDGQPFGSQKSALTCDDVCILEERNRKLAQALNIDLSEKAPAGPEYHRLLFEFCHKNSPAFALKIEETLRDFLRDPKKQLYNFPPMKKEQRGFIHLLCLAYNLQTESVDQEPRRSVIVRRGRDSREPSVLLTAAFKRGDWISMPLVSQSLSDPLEKLLEKPEKAKEKGKTQAAVNAVLMTGVDSSISLRDLREVVAGFVGTVTFEISRVDATSVVILPDSTGSDVTLLEELLIRIIEILKVELTGVFSSVVLCWVNHRFEVSIPEEKPKAAVAPKQLPKAAPTFAGKLASNTFSLLGTQEPGESVWDKAKKGKAKEVAKKPVKDGWEDSSTESLIRQFSEEPAKSVSEPSPSTTIASPVTVSLPSSQPAQQTPAAAPLVQLPKTDLSNFRPNLPVEDDGIVDDWTQLLPDDDDDVLSE